MCESDCLIWGWFGSIIGVAAGEGARGAENRAVVGSEVGIAWRSPPRRRETGPGRREGAAPGRGASEHRPGAGTGPGQEGGVCLQRGVRAAEEA